MMKLVFLSALVAVALADVSHLVGPHKYGSSVLQRSAPAFVHQPQHAVEGGILRQTSDISPDGSYQYGYETDTGISAEEQGSIRANGAELEKVAQGTFSWISPEGEHVQMSYVADGNGYQPTGSHVPTPPPVPAAIARALDWIAAHPAPAEHGAKVFPGAHQPQGFPRLG